MRYIPGEVMTVSGGLGGVLGMKRRAAVRPVPAPPEPIVRSGAPASAPVVAGSAGPVGVRRRAARVMER